MTADEQIDKLANFIMLEFNEEITEGEGAVDVAIKIMSKYKIMIGQYNAKPLQGIQS